MPNFNIEKILSLFYSVPTWPAWNHYYKYDERSTYYDNVPTSYSVGKCPFIQQKEELNPSIAHIKIAYYNGVPRYQVKMDQIFLPRMKNFKHEDFVRSTLYHELIHATGAANRLARERIVNTRVYHRFSTEHAMEEITAELATATLLYNEVDARVTELSMSYIQAWHRSFDTGSRPRLPTICIRQAIEAIEYLFNNKEV